VQSAACDCESALGGELVELQLDEIIPGKLDIRSSPGDLDGLETSIISHGLLNPIVVRRIHSSHYEVIAGHRRFQAVSELGLSKIPARVVEANDKESYEIFLVENLQHQTLDPLDEARAFHRYVSSKEENGLGYGSVTELAKRIGKSQAYVSNRISLLRLGESTVRTLLEERGLSVSHVEELASISDNPAGVEELASLIAKKRISVRVLESTIQLLKSGLSTSRALELASIESDLGFSSTQSSQLSNLPEDLLKRTKRVLEATLSYVDSTQPELQTHKVVYYYWARNVRAPIHRAIDGAIICQKRLSRARSRRQAT